MKGLFGKWCWGNWIQVYSRMKLKWRQKVKGEQPCVCRWICGQTLVKYLVGQMTRKTSLKLLNSYCGSRRMKILLKNEVFQLPNEDNSVKNNQQAHKQESGESRLMFWGWWNHSLKCACCCAKSVSLGAVLAFSFSGSLPKKTLPLHVYSVLG